MDKIIEYMLEEDEGFGDITSNAVVDEGKEVNAYIVSKDEGILTSYITYESEQVKCDYYLFFGFDSCNIGELNAKNKTMNAFELIKELKTL